MKKIVRREYLLQRALWINRIKILRVVVDPHVDKHRDHIDDELILDAARGLGLNEFEVSGVDEEFTYYTSKLRINDKNYKVVWLTEFNKNYVGIITMFRDRRL